MHARKIDTTFTEMLNWIENVSPAIWFASVAHCAYGVFEPDDICCSVDQLRSRLCRIAPRIDAPVNILETRFANFIQVFLTS